MCEARDAQGSQSDERCIGSGSEAAVMASYRHLLLQDIRGGKAALRSHLRQKPGHPSLVRPWGCQDRARADPWVSSHSRKCITLLAFSCKFLLAGLGKALMWATALRWVCARIPALSLLSNLILIPSYLDDNMHSLRQILSNWE